MKGERAVAPEHILAARVGHGANCSSIGSVVDTLFAAAVVGTAVFAAVAAALAVEEVRVVGGEEGAPSRVEDAEASGDGGAAP